MGYENGKIYRIVCNVSGKQYIGSTIQSLSKRLNSHKGNFTMWKSGNYHYTKSFDVFENGDFNIILIENYPCDSKDELTRRERHFIETLECVNRNIPTRTNKEYYHDNKERYKQYRQDKQEHYKQIKKEYYETHKEEIKAKWNKQKYECECGVSCSLNHKARHFQSKKHQEWERYNNI